MTDRRPILITGGAGYVGSKLVRRLVSQGRQVRVLDTFWFNTPAGFKRLMRQGWRKHLTIVEGDIRDAGTVARAVEGCGTVIHLACVANDPSFNLDPALGKAINHDAFLPLVRISKAAGVGLFLYASTSSVYGASEAPEVTEETECRPLTDYSLYKLLCEQELWPEETSDFTPCVFRPATVYGVSPRMRFDLVVNMFVGQAISRKEITVHGGRQYRPNIYIDDLVRAYEMALDASRARARGTWNVGAENFDLATIAGVVREVFPARVVLSESKDDRSYRITSTAIREQLGFATRVSLPEGLFYMKRTIGKLMVLPFEDSRFHNIKRMREIIER